MTIFITELVHTGSINKIRNMKKSLFSLLLLAVGSLATAQIVSISTITTGVQSTFGLGTTTPTVTNYTTTTQNGTNNYNNGRGDYNNITFSNSSSGSTGTGMWNNNNGNTYGNGYNNNYSNNGYNNGYTNSYGNNSYNYNNTDNNQNSYTTNNDGYGSTVEIEDESGNRTIVETTTDSTQAEASKSIKDKINAHMVHFTGLVMSDQFNEGNLSKAYVMDKYSEFLKPGKYNNITTTLPNSTAFTFDGIAVPPKTKLIIYSGPNFTGTKLVEITGPAIINNNKWEFDERYIGANRKTYCPDLQSTFPQNVRKWSSSNMHDWQSGSIEILEVPE